MNQQTKVVVIVGSILAALLVVVIVIGITIAVMMSKQAQQDAYEDCMARYGYVFDDPTTTLDIPGMVAAAEQCTS